MRSTLHSIMHTFLRSADNRSAVLKFFAQTLSANEKRSQIHSEEKKLARDGFMINLLSVLQKLSIKIRLQKVDPNYPFYTNALVSIEKDTKLRHEENDYKQWVVRSKWHCLFFSLEKHISALCRLFSNRQRSRFYSLMKRHFHFISLQQI